MKALPPPITPRHQQAKLVRIIGHQMRTAREMCNLTLSTAARELGYANPSKLSKIENASDTKTVPLLTILKAAKRYEVSIDFLFGITDDWETSARMTQEREVSPWIAEQFEYFKRKELDMFRRINDRIEVLQLAVSAISSAASDINIAMCKFCQLNPQFEDMPGSNRLYTACARLQDASANANARMKRFGIECRYAAMRNDRQPSLFQ